MDITKTVTTSNETGAEEIDVQDLPKVFIGKVPISACTKGLPARVFSRNELTVLAQCCARSTAPSTPIRIRSWSGLANALSIREAIL